MTIATNETLRPKTLIPKPAAASWSHLDSKLQRLVATLRKGFHGGGRLRPQRVGRSQVCLGQPVAWRWIVWRSRRRYRSAQATDIAILAQVDPDVVGPVELLPLIRDDQLEARRRSRSDC